MYLWVEKLVNLFKRNDPPPAEEKPKTLKDEFSEDGNGHGIEQWFSTHRQVSRQERAARLKPNLFR